MVPGKKKKVKPVLPAAKVKRMMQEDEDVGKVTPGGPELVAKAVELFVVEMGRKLDEISLSTAQTIVGPAHLKLLVKREKVYDFLADIVADAPDLELLATPREKVVPKKPKPKPKKRPAGATEAAATKRPKAGEGAGDGPASGRRPEEELAAMAPAAKAAALSTIALNIAKPAPAAAAVPGGGEGRAGAGAGGGGEDEDYDEEDDDYD